MATLVQSTKSVTVLPLPASFTGASGTRGLVEVTLAFDNPISNGNKIILAVMGNVPLASSVFDLGGILGFVDGFPSGGALPARTYWVALTYTGADGLESMIGPIGQYDIDAGHLLRVFRPNIEDHSTHPGITSFSIYASTTGPTNLKLVSGAANLDPVTPQPGLPWWIEPTGGLVLTGTDPPDTPVHDSLGNAYTQEFWVSQPSIFSNNGQNAMGFFQAISIGGSPTIKFLACGFNANSAIQEDAVCGIIATEWAGPTGSVSARHNYVQQTGSGTGDISLPLTDSNMVSRVTAWLVSNGILNSGQTAAVVDFSPYTGTDLFLAIYCNPNHPGNSDPPTPSLTDGIYTFIDKVVPPGAPATDNYPMWLWYNSVEAPPPPGSAHLALRKQVNGSANPTSWTVKADNSTDHLSGAGSVARTAVTPGVFVLTETGGVVGYSGPTLSLTGTGGLLSGNLLTLADGDDVTVIFINSNCSGLRSRL